MLVAIIVLSIALIALTTYLLYYKYQLKDICNQLSFISNNDSFKLVQLQIKPKEVYQLAEMCNKLLRKQRELNQQFIEKKEEVNATIVSLSHDIRTPITSLRGYLQLAELSNELSDKSRYIELAQTRMKQIISLVDELFYYSKLQNPEYVIELEPVDVINTLQKSLFSFIDEFSNKDSSEPDLSLSEAPLYVVANRQALERVLGNIFNNYFIHGRGTLSIRYEEEQNEITIHFSNLMKEDQTIHGEKLFDRFYKGDPSRTHHSSGLGLSIVRSLMEKMNGSTQFRIEENRFNLSTTLAKSEGFKNE